MVLPFSVRAIQSLEAGRAEEEQGYIRHKKASRNRAFVRFVSEMSGRAYIRKAPKRKDQSKQIADGWRRVRGDIDATAERMRQRGDSEDDIWATAENFMPPQFLAYLKRKNESVRGDLIKEIHEVTFTEGESRHSTPGEESQQEAESPKRVTSKTLQVNSSYGLATYQGKAC
jgi:hypothetical protein